jgi:hypothetical protein
MVEEEATPDWDYWLDCIAWPLRDAVCLSLNLEPRHQAVIGSFERYEPFTRYRERTLEALHDRLQQVYDAFFPNRYLGSRRLVGLPGEVNCSDTTSLSGQSRWDGRCRRKLSVVVQLHP